MSKPSFSLSTYVKFTVPQNFVIMLTWKIFVTIMSMVSLTLQMNTSGSGSNSDPTQFKIFDKKLDRDVPIVHNNYNYFTNKSARECYAELRKFCQSENDYVTSDECAKKGILYYRISPYYTPLRYADGFFKDFPLVPGDFKLPEAFCEEKGQRCIDDLEEYIYIVQNLGHGDQEIESDSDHTPRPEDKEADESNLVHTPQPEDQEADESAEKLLRKDIAQYAFFYNEIFNLDKENFKRKYLEHISEHVSSSNATAYECFEEIRLFCQSKNDYVISDECAKKGILYYRKIPNRPLQWADDFFQKFPLVPGDFKLPEAFCQERVSIWHKWFFAGTLGQECINVLQKYKDLVQAPRPEDQETDESDIFKLDEENFERKYLEHISEHVSSSDKDRDPQNYCKEYL